MIVDISHKLWSIVRNGVDPKDMISIACRSSFVRTLFKRVGSLLH